MIDIQCCSIRVIRRRLTLAIKMNGLTLRCLMALSRNARTQGVPLVTSGLDITLFVPLDRPTADKNAEQQTDDKSALKPIMLNIPGEPSESERRLHELTHLPYRDWCAHCVKSKGRQSHAVKK